MSKRRQTRARRRRRRRVAGSRKAGPTWSVRDAGPVGEPDGGANTAQLHQQEPGHQNQESKLAPHGIHVHHQHLEGHLACTQKTAHTPAWADSVMSENDVMARWEEGRGQRQRGGREVDRGVEERGVTAGGGGGQTGNFRSSVICHLLICLLFL